MSKLAPGRRCRPVIVRLSAAVPLNHDMPEPRQRIGMAHPERLSLFDLRAGIP